jgi:hypothetical protein
MILFSFFKLFANPELFVCPSLVLAYIFVEPIARISCTELNFGRQAERL